MSGSSRRRVSKWDNKDSDALPEILHEKPPSRKPRESLSPSRAPRRQESRSRESMVPWGREGNGAKMSPGIDDWGNRHHSRSPRNDDWGRSYRSRSRSRSRSPTQNSRREPQRNDRSRSRSAVSGQMCRDFPTGRCRKGNHCQYIHQDAELYDGARPLKGSSPDEWDNRHQRTGGGSRYSPDDTKDSAARSERYAHHDSMPQVIEKGPAEDSYRERKSDHRSRDAYPDRNRDRETPMCKFFAAGSCRNGTRCRFSHQANKEGFSSERRSHDARQGSNRKFENDPVWDGPTWNDATGMLDNTVVQGWGDDKNEIQEPSAKEMITTVRSEDDSWSQDIVNNNEPKTRDEEKPPQRKNGMEMSPRDIIKPSSFDPMNPQPQSLPSMPFPAVTTGETSYERHYPHGFHEPKALDDSYSRMNPGYKDNIPAAYQEEGRNGVPNSDHTRVSSNPSMNAPLPINPSVGQGQLPFPLLHSGMDVNQMQTLHNSSSFLDGNIVADGSSSHFTNINASSIPSTANPNTTVNTEQLAKLSHLTASLAQLIESRQQLPQGDTMANQADPPDMSKQYDPIPDSTDANLPNLGSHTLPGRVEQKSSDKKEPIHKSGIVNHEEPVVGSSKGNENGQKVTEGGVKAPENGPSQDMGVDDGEDDGKKSKVKGMRVFKFALADFVKELLKPSWKDGHVSKEAYKTIVKKVVDKVIETLGPQVPQGKEKIDQYLSCSKPKLEKLVQAYVGKYQKGKV